MHNNNNNNKDLYHRKTMDHNDRSETEEIVNVYLDSSHIIMRLLCGQDSRDRPGLDRTVRDDKYGLCEDHFGAL